MLVSRVLVHLSFIFASVSAGVIDNHDNADAEWSREVRVGGTGSRGGEDAGFSVTERDEQRNHNGPQSVLESTVTALGSVVNRDNLLAAAKPSAIPDLPNEPLPNRSKMMAALNDKHVASSVLTERSTKRRAEPVTDVMAMTGNRPEPRAQNGVEKPNKDEINTPELVRQYNTLTPDLIKCIVCVHVCRVSQEQSEWPLELLYPR
ncbi:hypothetical protein LX36DRAFT_748520 [Colletotrichum falcatum]|nr:hypothetical protein LX36DRAFT_748520 [Colletotrichum falcatum]